MANGYDPRSFWNERFCKYGHTGEVNALLYAYDQPQRISAIGKALARANVPINADTKILDIGCGTGDLIASLMRHGKPEITGIDISDGVIGFARRRFVTNRKVNLHTIKVEEMNFPANSFDLVIGINILQHVIGEQAFSKTIENIVRVLRGGGYIVVMDFSPIEVKNRHPAPCVIIRSRQEHINAFAAGGCKFISEFGLPRIGVRLYRMVSGVVQLAMELKHSKERDEARVGEEKAIRNDQNPFLRSVFYLTKVVLLKLAMPFDNLLSPFPSKYTDMRILIFEKVSE